MIKKRHDIKLGVVPTHLKFVGGLVPDEGGNLPRNSEGQLLTVANLGKLQLQSSVPIECVQIPYFAGANAADVKEMVEGFRSLGVEVFFILMVGGADPMNPADEDQVAELLVGGLKAAIEHGITEVASTSVEEWMKEGSTRKDGADFEAAVAQNVKVHTRAAREAGLADSCVKAWHIEFLRGIEFQTFTDIGRAWKFVKAANDAWGSNLFRVMVDAAHCGDSDLSVDENVQFIGEIADADSLGIFHASAKTTRGCLSTDDGWIAMLLEACARTGKLSTAFVEVFHHEDAALEGLRTADPRHGIDTRDGRDYDDVVVDGLLDVTRRLNNLKTRGIL